MHSPTQNKRIRFSWLLTGFVWMLLISLAGCGTRRSTPLKGGIPNVGNTCYLNATMQILSKLYPTVFERNNSELAKAGQVIVEKTKNDRKIVTTGEANAFLDALEKTGWPKDGAEKDSQQDAEEFFMYILSQLNAKKPIILWEKTNSTEHKSSFFILPMIAGLSLKNESSEKGLQAYIDNFFKEESIVGSSPQQTKSSWIESPPTIFAIQAKRFNGTRQGDTFVLKKSQEHIENPFSFTLKAEHQYSPTSQAKDIKYNLAGFIVHIGDSTESGHYIAYIKRKRRWKKYNDNTVTFISPKEAEQAAEQAYLYFYRKQNQ